MIEFLILLLVAQISTQLTQWLTYHKKMGVVRGSSLTTLLFIFTTLPFDFVLKAHIHSICIGATFVGLSDPKRLPAKPLVVACLIFTCLYYFAIHHMHGIGGSLGLFALISCSLVYLLRHSLASSN
jgi:hypothetical protein